MLFFFPKKVSFCFGYIATQKLWSFFFVFFFLINKALCRLNVLTKSELSCLSSSAVACWAYLLRISLFFFEGRLGKAENPCPHHIWVSSSLSENLSCIAQHFWSVRATCIIHNIEVDKQHWFMLKAEVLSSSLYFTVQDTNLPAQNFILAEPPQKSENSWCTGQRFQMCGFH